MRPLMSALVLGALVLVPASATGQGVGDPSRWSLEFSGDAAFPLDKLGIAELETGFGLGANLRYRLQPHLQAYAGWEWHRFRSDELVATQTIDVEETGYTAGLRFEHPFRGDGVGGAGRASGAGYWLRAGALINHIELENSAGDRIADTKHGLGWEAGAGVSLPLGDRVSLLPGVRYRTLSRDLTLGSSTRSVTLNYVSAGVGLAFSF